MLSRFGFFLLSILLVQPAYADWTPLITSTDFDGMKADVLTTAGGVISVVLIIIGLSWLVRAFVK
jgi:hypothetical protein